MAGSDLLDDEPECDEPTDAVSGLRRDWIDSATAASRWPGSPEAVVDRDAGEVARGDCGSGAIGRYVVAGAERVVIRSSSESDAADEADDILAESHASLIVT
ncbi:hypothetical protein L1887_51439 [Cichorium endivia]|nr:hypothetical protein L1887_51439 [Cichorium endivia]